MYVCMYVTFWDWLFPPLSVTSWRCVHILAWVNTLLLVIAEWDGEVGMDCGLLNHSHFMDLLVVSSFWWLQIKPLWIFVYKVLCRHELSFLWNKCALVYLLGCMLIACSVLEGTAKLFSRVAVPFCLHPPQPCMRDPVPLSPWAFGVVTVLYFSRSDRCVVIMAWSRFPDG